MRRTALIAAFVGALMLVVAEARAQLVPISECGSAIPCNIPKGLRPADAAALAPNGRPSGSNTAIGVQLNPAEGFKPEIMTRSIAEDPSDRAARIFVKNNPSFAMPRTAPAPAAAEPVAPEKDKTKASGKTPPAAAPKLEIPAAPPPAAPSVPTLPDR